MRTSRNLSGVSHRNMITLPYIQGSKRCRVVIFQLAWVWPR